MNLSRLKQADDIDVRKWLEENIPEITAYQKQKIYDNEIVRWAPFYFYERRDYKKDNVSFWWRFTILLVPVYFIMIWLIVLLKFVITGDRYLSRKYLDKFHYPWMHKLNIHF